MRTLRVAGTTLALAVLIGCPGDFGDDVGGTTVQTGVVLLAPGNLAGSPQSGTEILVTWTDTSSGESGYRVDTSYIPIVTDSDVANWEIIPANSTSYSYSTGPNTTTYFRVVSVHVPKGLQSPFSNVISVTTPDVPPAANVSASLISATEIRLTWFDLPQETGYRVERSVDSGATWAVLATLGANTTAYSDQGLAGDTEYCYRVIAFNGNGDGPPSTVVCELTPTASMTITRHASPAWDGLHTSIAVDAAGVEHISHYDSTNTRTLYTTFSAGAFSTSVADSGVFTTSDDVGSGGTSIDLDGAGIPHLATTRFATTGGADADLRYATKPGAAMIPTTMDSAGFAGDLPALKVSPIGGALHILYLEGFPGSHSVRHAVNTGSGWTTATIFSGQTILSLSLDIDSSGNLHASFLNTDQASVFQIHYGRKLGGGAWTISVAVSLSWIAQQSIAADGSGNAHLVYDRSGNLYHSTNEGGSWAEEAVHVDPTRFVGTHNSIVVNRATGRIHAAYHDLTFKTLRYARKDSGAGWVLRLIDASAQVGEFTSIALDTSGVPRIAYYDATNRDLKRAIGSP